MSEKLRIQPLQSDDLPQALRLSTQVGWNQLIADWQRMRGLFPGQCLGGWLDGQLIASGTLATYGTSLGWVGMIIVDEAHRGLGFGGMIFDAILGMSQLAGVHTLGLSATDLGQPVYAKRGFGICGGVNRWLGAACARSGGGSTIGGDWAAILERDRSVTGLDRSALLDRLARASGGRLRTVSAGDQLAGYAFARPGRIAEYIGPIVADVPSTAMALIDDLLADIHRDSAERPILIDAPAGSPIESHIRDCGFSISRRLARMLLPPRSVPLISDPRIFAGSAFETS